MRDFPEHADAGGAYALLGWVVFALYLGISLALGGHTFRWFLIGVGVVVGLFVAPLIVMAPFILLHSRGREDKLNWSPIRQPGESGPGLTITGWMTLQRMQDERRLSYQFGYLWHHLRHPEHWWLIGGDPDHGCYVETRAQLESSTTKEELDSRSVDRVVMWLCVLTIVPCMVGAILFFPVLMIFPGGASMWKLAGMAYVGTGLIVVGCYAHDRIAIRARRRVQRRAILAKNP